jgi:mRNA interferase MazF
VSSSSFEAGDIVVLDFPYSDQHASKMRPAMIITPKKYNEREPDVIVLKITSAQTPRPYSVALSAEDLASGNLKKQSLVRADYPLVAEKTIIRAKIASATPALLNRVKLKMRELYEIKEK